MKKEIIIIVITIVLILAIIAAVLIYMAFNKNKEDDSFYNDGVYGYEYEILENDFVINDIDLGFYLPKHGYTVIKKGSDYYVYVTMGSATYSEGVVKELKVKENNISIVVDSVGTTNGEMVPQVITGTKEVVIKFNKKPENLTITYRNETLEPLDYVLYKDNDKYLFTLTGKEKIMGNELRRNIETARDMLYKYIADYEEVEDKLIINFDCYYTKSDLITATNVKELENIRVKISPSPHFAYSVKTDEDTGKVTIERLYTKESRSDSQD